MACCLIGCEPTPQPEKLNLKTVCNPVNISYRFRPETYEVSRREAADPAVLVHDGLYYLFASKSGGYWVSDDLKTWDFVQTNKLKEVIYRFNEHCKMDTIKRANALEATQGTRGGGTAF